MGLNEIGADAWIELIAEEVEIDVESLRLQLSKLTSTLSYYSNNGSSSAWKREVFEVAKRTHSVHVQRLEEAPAMKKEIRSNENYKCQMCGKRENSCNYVVHLAGAATKGSLKGNYNASEWKGVDIDALSSAWVGFQDGYDAVFQREDSQDADLDQIYTGIFVPGKTCLNRLIKMIKSQNLLMEVFYSVFNTIQRIQSIKETSPDVQFPSPTCSFSMKDVVAVGEIIEALHGAQNTSMCPEIEEDDGYWNRVTARFARIEDIDGDPTSVEFLSAAYDRMQSTLISFRPRVSKTIVIDDDDDEEEEEDGVDDEGDEEEEDDDEEDEDDEDEEEEEEEEDDDAEWEESRRNPKRCRTRSSKQKQLILEATRSPVEASVARKLRIHPDNALRSRKNTLDELVGACAHVCDFGEKSESLMVASVLAKALNTYEKRLLPSPRSDQLQQIIDAAKAATKLAQLFSTRRNMRVAAIFSAACVVLVEMESLLSPK